MNTENFATKARASELRIRRSNNKIPKDRDLRGCGKFLEEKRRDNMMLSPAEGRGVPSCAAQVD